MSILVEKRNQYLDEAEALVANRAAEIDAQCAAFRANLEIQPIAGLSDLQAVIEALNQVIAFEDEHPVEAPVAEPAAEPIVEEAPVAKPVAEEKSSTEHRFINIFQK